MRNIVPVSREKQFLNFHLIVMISGSQIVFREAYNLFFLIENISICFFLFFSDKLYFSNAFLNSPHTIFVSFIHQCNTRATRNETANVTLISKAFSKDKF